LAVESLKRIKNKKKGQALLQKSLKNDKKNGEKV
jgi:hypothetical protein